MIIREYSMRRGSWRHVSIWSWVVQLCLVGVSCWNEISKVGHHLWAMNVYVSSHLVLRMCRAEECEHRYTLVLNVTFPLSGSQRFLFSRRTWVLPESGPTHHIHSSFETQERCIHHSVIKLAYFFIGWWNSVAQGLWAGLNKWQKVIATLNLLRS